MLKQLSAIVLSLVLLVGCSSEKEEKVEPVQKPQTVENVVKDTLKNVTVVEFNESDNGHVNVVVKLSDDVGEGGQIAGLLSHTKKLVKKLENVKTITIGVMYQDQRVFQFTTNVETGERTIEKSTPYIDEYLKKTNNL